MMNQRGQGSIFSFFTLLIGLVLIVAFLPLLNDLVAIGVASNMSALGFGSIIQLLLGMTGILLVLLFFMGVISDFQTRQQYYGP
jgi:uncharacterized membrane protein